MEYERSHIINPKSLNNSLCGLQATIQSPIWIVEPIMATCESCIEHFATDDVPSWQRPNVPGTVLAKMGTEQGQADGVPA